MTTTPLAEATYVLSIVADSGYESTTEGRCNVQQYSAAVRALHDAAWAHEITQARADLEAEVKRLRETLEAIAECCDEDHSARDYASRQTEIRGMARAALEKQP